MLTIGTYAKKNKNPTNIQDLYTHTHTPMSKHILGRFPDFVYTYVTVRAHVEIISAHAEVFGKSKQSSGSVQLLLLLLQINHKNLLVDQ